MSAAPEIRELPDSDLDPYYDIRAQAFGRPEVERAAWRDRVAADGDAGRIGAYVEGELVGGLRVLPAGQWLSGRSVSTGAIAAVVVRPEMRGRGVARSLLFAALDWMRERDIALSTLHPASTRVYRSGGWELAGSQESIEVNTRSLAGLRGSDALDRTVSRFTADDWPAVRACYDRLAPSHHGYLDRSPSLWLLREPAASDDGWFTYGVRMNERVSGYVRYRQVPGSGWGYRIAVDDFMAEDQPTAIALWRYLGAHSMQAEHVEVPHACIDPLVLLLDEQDLKVLTTNRWMTRIVDLAAAIEQRPYPAGWRGSFSLIVDDPWPAGITGSWTVAIADGAGTAVRREDGADPPDGIALDVGALSALMIGRFSASTLRTAGRIRGTDAAVDTIDEVLRAPMPQLNDDF